MHSCVDIVILQFELHNCTRNQNLEMILFRMQGGCLSAGKIKMARNDLIRIELNG